MVEGASPLPENPPLIPAFFPARRSLCSCVVRILDNILWLLLNLKEVLLDDIVRQKHFPMFYPGGEYCE